MENVVNVADIHIVMDKRDDGIRTTVETKFRGDDADMVNLFLALTEALNFKSREDVVKIMAIACAKYGTDVYESTKIDYKKIKKAAEKARREGAEDEKGQTGAES